MIAADPAIVHRSKVTGERSVGLTWTDLDNLMELVYNVIDVTTADSHAADDAFKALLDSLAAWQAWTYDGTFTVTGEVHNDEAGITVA